MPKHEMMVVRGQAGRRGNAPGLSTFELERSETEQSCLFAGDLARVSMYVFDKDADRRGAYADPEAVAGQVTDTSRRRLGGSSLSADSDFWVVRVLGIVTGQGRSGCRLWFPTSCVAQEERHGCA